MGEPLKPLSVNEWLDQPWKGDLPFDFGCPIPGEGPFTVRQVFACLVAKNGGFRPSGYGITQSGGLYGFEGLVQREFFALMEMTAFLEGMLVARGEMIDPNIFKAEYDRVAQLRGMSTDG